MIAVATGVQAWIYCRQAHYMRRGLRISINQARIANKSAIAAVSYTHLDVYKRQGRIRTQVYSSYLGEVDGQELGEAPRGGIPCSGNQCREPNPRRTSGDGQLTHCDPLAREHRPR